MNATRLQKILGRLPSLKIAVAGDFCLDRYLEIDSEKKETSIETSLEVHNVTRVRSLPGAAGTVLANLSALRIGRLFPVGFTGEDGEGWELRRAMQALPGVALDHFFQTPERRTFCYTKPLVVREGTPPRELNRLDLKNWAATPPRVTGKILDSLRSLAPKVDAMILLEQVDHPGTGAFDDAVLDEIPRIASASPELPILADSRHRPFAFHGISLKLNLFEFSKAAGVPARETGDLLPAARRSARDRGAPLIITMAERGMLGVLPRGDAWHVPSLPLRGPIDIVGAGDCATASLASAFSAKTSLAEALEMATLSTSLAIHKLGTTGTASPAELLRLIESSVGGLSAAPCE